MLRDLIESGVLFDYLVTCLFQGYYLTLNCKNAPWKEYINKQVNK